MVQILQPLEITHCYASTIKQNIWHEAYSLVFQYLFRLLSSGPVGPLSNNLALEPISILFVNGLLQGSRDKYVAGHIYHSLILISLGALRIRHDTFISRFHFCLQQQFRVNSIWIIYTSIMFRHAHQYGSFLYKILSSPIPNISKTLQYYFFAF
jgi:hypothetical protein